MSRYQSTMTDKVWIQRQQCLVQASKQLDYWSHEFDRLGGSPCRRIHRVQKELRRCANEASSLSNAGAHRSGGAEEHLIRRIDRAFALYQAVMTDAF